MNEILEKDKIENLIYEIRGKQVMLDSDLAKLYECKNGTKEVNQAVRNNMAKFPGRFSWKLSDDEYKNLRSKFLTSSQKNNNYGGRRNNPRVFTEQGVAMLATILKTKVATEVSIAIMDAFVALRHYIGRNEYRLSNIETKIIEHDSEIKILQKSFEKFDENKKYNETFYNGQIYDAYSKIIEIFRKSKKDLIIIDRYADKVVLDMIKNLKVKVTLITKENGLLTKRDIEKYNKQYDNLKVVYKDNFHDRYFIIDKREVYHCGASINHAGSRTFSINKWKDKIVKKEFIHKVNTIIK